MRRWLQLGLIDFLVALVLLPPGSILAFQATLLFLRLTHEPKIQSGMRTSIAQIETCNPWKPMTERERLSFLKRLVVRYEAALAAGELDPVECPDPEADLSQWRSEICRLELKLAAEDFLRQPHRDNSLIAEGLR